MGSNGTVVEEQEIPTYASSLPVPNVQEIVREEPLNVPQRYIRDKEEMLKSTDKIHLSSEIPVIDLSMLSNANKDELKKLDLACKDWGFFQVNIQKIFSIITHQEVISYYIDIIIRT